MNLYQERLLDHYRNPHNRGHIDAPDFASGLHNPSCGDTVSLTGVIEGNTLKILMFEGSGCVISQALASMLCTMSIGKQLADLDQLRSDDVMAMVGMPLGPTRLKCALLPLEALHTGLAAYRMRLKKDSNAQSCQIDVRGTTGCQ